MIPRIITAGLLGCLLLSGCSLWHFPGERSADRPELPPNPLASARELVSAGRLGEALALLDEAIAEDPEALEYQTVREQTLHQKALLEQRFQDRLLIEQSKSRRAQLAILDQWALMDPDNLELADRRDAIRQSLQNVREPLSNCALRQIEDRPDLAQTCLKLALSIEPTHRDRTLLAMLAERKKETAQVKARQRQDLLEQERKNRIDQNLAEARARYEKNEFNAARKLLNEVLEEDPGNQQAQELLTQLEAHLQTHLEQLLKTGDKLYQEGEIEGAQDIWEAALQLDPENPLAKEKLERAQRVLENLESLRKTGQPPGPPQIP
jgi:tetratricopeptide (TPR) repeat protein